MQIFNLRQYFAPVKRIAVIKLHFITSGVPEMTDYSVLPSSFCFKLTIHSIKYDWKGQERSRGVLLIEVSVKRELSVFYFIIFITPRFITTFYHSSPCFRGTERLFSVKLKSVRRNKHCRGFSIAWGRLQKINDRNAVFRRKRKRKIFGFNNVIKISILGLHCHAMKNKNANHSIQKE